MPLYETSGTNLIINSTNAATSITSVYSTAEEFVNSPDGKYILPEDAQKYGFTVKGVKPRPELSPTLYFNFVKSKLAKTEIKNLKERLANLKYLLDSCEDTGQVALREELMKQVVFETRRQEAAACGYDTVVSKKVIEKYRSYTKTRVTFGPLTDFPRPIPKPVRNAIAKAKRRNVFDTFMVLYVDPVNEPQADKRSTKEKILDKDPILFGNFAHDPDSMYYITDWVDEVCDLTLDKFVNEVKKVDADYSPDVVDAPTCKDIERMKAEIDAKAVRLAGTQRSNYHELAAVTGIEDTKFSFGLVKRTLGALWTSFKKRK